MSTDRASPTAEESIHERERFWPGLQNGFDAVLKGNEFHLVFRVDVVGLVVAGTICGGPLMSASRAARCSPQERREAVEERSREGRSYDAITALLGWWRAHSLACEADEIRPFHDDALQTSIRASETEPLERIPKLLLAWRTERTRQLKAEAVALEIVRAVKIDDYARLFPAASRRRRLIAVLGPTNSGKTHFALCRLSEAGSGYYAGPLRLLALEVYSRLNREFGTSCSLVTGEERRLFPGALHHACTVEMVDPQREVEVAVIDECQLIADQQRGWAWTQAIACANASEVYVLGTLQSRTLIERISRMLGLELEVKVMTRLSPLQLADRALGSTPTSALKQVMRGDCLVVFTRRDCLLLRDSLIEAGHVVACLYGALAPEARQAQADRFTSGEAGVIVATDVVGLGLNLKGLKRTVLVASQKYDGVSRKDVPLDLLRQIAGRAGRYGHTEEDAGIAMGLTRTEHEMVRRALVEAPADLVLDRLPVAPSGEVLKRLESVTGERRLSVLLTLFVAHCSGGEYKPQLPGEALERANSIDKYDLPIETRFLLTQVPVSSREAESASQWTAWVRAVATAKSQCLVDFVRDDAGTLTLEEAEREIQLLNAYCWLALKIPDIFTDECRARALLVERSSFVTEKLKSRTTLGAKNSPTRVGLPPWYWERRSQDWLDVWND